jgi:hypothetical protein
VRTLLSIAVAVILILGVIYIYYHRQELGLVSGSGSEQNTSSGGSGDQSAGTDQTAQPAHPANIAWQPVDRAPDGFKVEMPNGIKETQVPAYNEKAGSEQVDMLYAYPDSDTCFSVAWADNPPVERVNGEAPGRTLDMARDDALARTGTTLVTESETNQQGFPALDFSAHNQGGGVFNSRLILAHKRLYMLTAAFPSTGARRDEDVAKFFGSFTVLPASSNE